MGRKLEPLVRAGVIPSGAQAAVLESMRDGGWRLFCARESTWWMERKKSDPQLVHHKVASALVAAGWVVKLREDAERYAEEHTITLAGQSALGLRKRWEAG